MKLHDFNSMPTDELWSLHELVTSELVSRISAEKARLEERLRRLGQSPEEDAHVPRPYPQVFPKYRNPAHPSETWAGRGKQPRWLTAQLRSGKKLDDFRIKSGVRHTQILNGESRRSREFSAS